MATTPRPSTSTADRALSSLGHIAQTIANHPLTMWGMAAALWVLGFLGPTRQAVKLMLHPLPDGQLPWTTNLEVAVGTAFLAVVNVVLTCAMLKTWGFSLTNAGILPRRDHREWFWIPAACLMACGANLIKSVMTDRALAWFPEHTHLYRSQATTDEALPSLLVTMLTAGPSEEIVLVPGLILLLVAGRCPLWLATTIAVAARTAFHLYYGAPVAAGVIVWALLLVVIWQVTGSALGAVAAHVLNNLIAAISHAPGTSTDAWESAYTWTSVAGLVLMIALIPHAIRTLRGLKATSTPGHRNTHLTHCPPIAASFNPTLTRKATT